MKFNDMDEVSKLDVLMNDNIDNSRAPSILGALWGFLLASITGGIILSLLAAPALVPISAAPKAVSAYWDTLPTELPDPPLPQHSYITDVNGKKIAKFYSENRVIVELEDVSQYVVDALVATEDSRFYEHDGVDWRGLARAFKVNTFDDKNQGASTITQQLVKNTLMLSASSTKELNAARENSYKRKLEEIRYAKALEEKFTKEEILEKYLNVVLFSNGVYGIGTAAEYYFSTSVDKLTLSQSATLVGLLKNPSSYNPINNPKNSLGRRNVVIDRMVATGAVTEEEGELAKEEKLNLKVKKTPNGCGSSKYPFFCQWVRDTVVDDPRLGTTKEEREKNLYLGGLTIQTTLDPKAYEDVQSVVDSTLGQDNRVAAGVAVVEPGTGRVLTINQNRSWGSGTDKNGNKRTEIVLPATVAYQSGSTFKPFGLAAALESGFPTNAIINAPQVFKPADMNTPKNGIQNLSRLASGPMSINKATAISSNTYFAELARRTGVLTVAEMARSLGISVPDTVGERDGSFILGTTDTSPIEMAGAYAAFAAGGIFCEPTGVDSITFPDGKVADDYDNCSRVMGEGTADTVQKALISVIDGPEETRSGKLAHINRPAGGKTGTTSSHAAAWFAGNTPDAATAIWLGDPRGGFRYPLSGGIRYNGRYVYDVYASQIAAPMWGSIMDKVLDGKPKTKFDLTSSGSNVGVTVVPDVRGMSVAQAVKALEQQGFTVEVNAKFGPETEGFTPNQVLNQEPFGGYKVFDPESISVELFLTSGSTKPKLSDK